MSRPRGSRAGARFGRLRHKTEQSLPTDAQDRKDIPLFWGLVNYFRDALIAVAKLSMIGNEQHNPGEPLHWQRDKGGDELDAQMRHTFEIGGIDYDLVPHSVKNAWRALATCQIELEETPWDTPVAEIVAKMRIDRMQREKDAQFDASIEGLGPPLAAGEKIHGHWDDSCHLRVPTPPNQAFANCSLVVLQHIKQIGPDSLRVDRLKAFGPFPDMNAANYFAKSLRANSSAPVSFVTLYNVSKLRTKKC